VGVQIHELDAGFFEGPLSEEVTFDARQGLMGVVVGLLDESQLFSLALAQSRLDRIRFLESFEGQDEKLGVVLVRQRREGDRGEPPRLEPVNGRRVDGHGLFRRNVGAVFQVVVLPLLLGLEVQPGVSYILIFLLVADAPAK